MLLHNTMQQPNLEDRIRKYWNTQPCNIKHSASDTGTAEFFREVSERRYRVEPHIAEFAGFHLWAGKRVLEIGCGIGSDAEGDVGRNRVMDKQHVLTNYTQLALPAFDI